MNIRPIKTEEDYDAALDRIEALWGAASGTPEGDELEVRLILVRAYEKENHEVPPPSPVGAIRFAMEQRGLKPGDLVPYLGSRSKVSEVLNGKRSLTLSMIRALHTGLGIPAESLISEGAAFPEEAALVVWTSFPVKEITARGWVTGFDPKDQAEEIMRKLAHEAGHASWTGEVCFRQGTRRNAKDDPYAIEAWILGVFREANRQGVQGEFRKDDLDVSFLRAVAQCSVFSDGPLKARELLSLRGVNLAVVPHFRRTYLDGAVAFLDKDRPVIALSLRHDRLDNFWFSLLHELAHLALGHVANGRDECITDDLDLHGALDDMEKEADKLAQEALIPEALLLSHPALRTARIADVTDLARRAGVHPAIAAGRIRFERKNYRILAQHVGYGEVRNMFGA